MSDLASEQLTELWSAVFGEPPSVVAAPDLTARILVACLPQTEPHSFKADPEEDGIPTPPKPPRSA